MFLLFSVPLCNAKSFIARAEKKTFSVSVCMDAQGEFLWIKIKMVNNLLSSLKSYFFIYHGCHLANILASLDIT